MIDKFLFSETLKNRLGESKVASINKGYYQTPFNQLSISALKTKMVLAQVQQEPIFYAIQKSMPAACLINVYYEVPGQQTEHWTGSGFLLQTGIVVTSNHVLPDENGKSVIRISFDGRSNISANINSRNEEIDIGTLSIEQTEIQPVPIAQTAPIPGEQIAVIGAPEGWNNIVTVGYVSAVDQTPEKLPEASWQSMIFIDADIYEGSSGSMVINNRGEVIGAVMGIIGKEAAEKNIGQNAVVPIKNVLKAIQ